MQLLAGELQYLHRSDRKHTMKYGSETRVALLKALAERDHLELSTEIRPSHDSWPERAHQPHQVDKNNRKCYCSV